MAFPGQSNFQSTDPNSAWIVHTAAGGTPNVCSITGWDFLYSLQEQLVFRINAITQTLTAWDGVVVNDATVYVNDPTTPGSNVPWNLDVLRALYVIGVLDSAPAAYTAAVQQDAQNQTISAMTVALAAWEIQFNEYTTPSGDDGYGIGSPAEVTVPAGAVLPAFGQLPPMPPGGGAHGFSCVVQPTAATVAQTPQQYVPFAFNPWIVGGIAAAGILGLVFLTKNVPVEKRENPRGRRRTRRRHAYI
jgi:hypothetical protein